MQVIVVLLDVNDHAPQLPAPVLDAYITENSLREQQKLLTSRVNIGQDVVILLCFCLL